MKASIDEPSNIILLNQEIQALKKSGYISSAGQISDGYHTFDELYEHRIVLYIALLQELDNTGKARPWKSLKHHDGYQWDGWFILGLFDKPGEQITYHLPMAYWEVCETFAHTLPFAPYFDGHTSADVLIRIAKLISLGSNPLRSSEKSIGI
jgi:hypothetical protein